MTNSFNGQDQGTTKVVDKRVRIRAKPLFEKEIYGDANSPTNPMKILYETNGVVFPYTPNISVEQNPNFGSESLTHFLQDYYYFTSINSTKLTIIGKLTANNIRESQYMLAVLHFFRSYTKMNFGEREDQSKRGLPPPTLLLDGYGDFMFNSLPVLVTNWSFDFPENIDYVRVDTKTPTPRSLVNVGDPDPRTILRQEFSSQNVNTSFQGYAYVPAETTLRVSLVVQKSPYKLKKEFNLQDFREGRLLGNTKGFI